MGHLVTRTPSSESFNFTFPSFVVRFDSMVMGPGRRVEIAWVDAAGDFAGPRNWAMCEKP
jgi:hypothetical protein